MSTIYRKVGTGISFGGGKPVLDIFCRDQDNKRHTVKVPNLPCFFYVKEDTVIEDEDLRKNILRTQHGYTSLYGEPLKKVFVRKISDIKRLGKLYDAFESDVKWDKKCLLEMQVTDKFIEHEGQILTLDPRFNALNDVNNTAAEDKTISSSVVLMKNDDSKNIVMAGLTEQDRLMTHAPQIGSEPWQVRHCVFDIEVVAKSKEELLAYDGLLICVVIWDSYTDQFYSLKLDTTEKDLLLDVLRIFRDFDFDIISGWNVEFDMGWIINKAQDYDIDLSLYFMGGKTFITKYTDFQGKFRQSFYIGGRTMLDAMELYKNKTATTEKLTSYNLKSVAATEKLEDWEDFGANVGEMWVSDPDKVLEYCKIDVERTVQIIQKKNLLDGALTVCKFYGCGFDDVKTNSKIIDSMAFLLKRDRILPNINRGLEKPSIVGAKVFKTQSGLHTGVGIFDAASLYPSIIGGLNVSPECIISEDQSKTMPDNQYVTVNLSEHKCMLLKKSNKLGLMNEVIMEMRKMREQIRTRRTEAIKVGDTELFALLNNEEKVAKGVLSSVYGVMGFNGFRLFNEDCANVITAVARDLITTIATKVEKDVNVSLIAGDTDSLFIKIPNAEYGFTVMDNMNEIAFDYINSLGVDERIIDMNYEKFFRWCMFVKTVTKKQKNKLYKKEGESAKKKYIGFISHVQSGPRELKEVSELYYKGFELRRSDSAKVLKTVMKQFFVLMEHGRWKSSVSYLKGVKAEFNSYDTDYISMPRSVNNEEAKGPWPDGLRYSKENLGFEFDSDSMPRLIYVKDQRKYPKTNVLCYQIGHVIPAEFTIDYDIMFEKIIKNKFENIIEALGLHWSVAIDNQDTLDAWC